MTLAAPAAGREREAADLERVLRADASGSIDAVEIALQREGQAAALTDPEALWAIAQGGRLGRVAVACVKGAGATPQDVVVE